MCVCVRMSVCVCARVSGGLVGLQSPPSVAVYFFEGAEC